MMFGNDMRVDWALYHRSVLETLPITCPFRKLYVTWWLTGYQFIFLPYASEL